MIPRTPSYIWHPLAEGWNPTRTVICFWSERNRPCARVRLVLVAGSFHFLFPDLLNTWWYQILVGPCTGLTASSYFILIVQADTCHSAAIHEGLKNLSSLVCTKVLVCHIMELRVLRRQGSFFLCSEHVCKAICTIADRAVCQTGQYNGNLFRCDLNSLPGHEMCRALV